MSVLPPLPERLSRIASASLPPEPTDSPSIGWAILGAGGIAVKFAHDVTRAGSAVVAVGSQTEGKAEAFANAHGIPFFGNYDEVLSRPDVDAVYVATTHNLHMDVALRAIAAGKPVLIEKPVTRNNAEFQRIRDAATSANVLVMEAMWSRFLPHYHVIRALIESGELGKVTYARADHGQRLRGVERMERADLAGGAALDLGVYPASFIHWVLGEPRSIIASGHLTDQGVDADSLAILHYDEASAVYMASMEGRLQNAAVVGFEYGRIELPREFYRPTEMHVVWNEESGPYEEVWSEEAINDFGFEYQAAAFARALAAGLTEVPGHGYREAGEVMAILDEIRRQVGVILPGE